MSNSTVGAGGPNPTTNYGRMFIALKPKKERNESSTEVIQRLRRSTAVVPGMKTAFQNLQNINVGARISKAEYQYTLQSSDTEALYRLAPEMRDKIAQLDMVWSVDTDLYIKNPQMAVEVDREQAARLRHHHRSGAPAAVQRLRQSSDRHDLHAVERLPDHPGERSRSSRTIRRTCRGSISRPPAASRSR